MSQQTLRTIASSQDTSRERGRFGEMDDWPRDPEVTCTAMSWGGSLVCDRVLHRGPGGHVWVAPWAPDGRHDDLAKDW